MTYHLENKRKKENNILHIFNRCKKDRKPVYIAGPMVRYSKLPFRALVREYNCDIVYSPMILAREFVRNAVARESDFSTNSDDTPLVVQVGVNNVTDILRFVEMIHPHVNAIGINCGCPIKEQVREGIGAALMSDPDLVCAMVKAVKDIYSDRIIIETKIRIHADINETIEYVKKIEAAGVDFITVHGRTKSTRSSTPVNLEAIKTIKKNVNVPVVANGDCCSLEDCNRIAEYTGCEGVMSARGLLQNPAMFSNYKKAPWGCVEKFMEYATAFGLPYSLAQHHFFRMLEGQISKQILRKIMECKHFSGLIDIFDEYFILKRSWEPGFGEAVEIAFKTILP